MPLAATIATQLTDHSSRSKTLTVGGVDVILVPGTGGNRLGTPLDSIRVSEKGAGGISTMSFTVEDPAIVFGIADGMEIVYWDVTNDLPIFRGWVEHWTQAPWGGIGRAFAISAIGPESLLDWAVLTADITFPIGTTYRDAIQSLASQSYATGPLRWPASFADISSQQFPLAGSIAATTNLAAALTITAGTSLREAVRQVIAITQPSSMDILGNLTLAQVTVDFWYGLRLWVQTPSDYHTNVLITDSPAVGALPATEDLARDTEGATVRAVFVEGVNAAGTGIVTDGTGIPGATAYITDATSDSAARLAAVANAYLSMYEAKNRTEFTLRSVLASALLSVRPSCTMSLIDPAFPGNPGIPATAITQIDKTFDGAGLEDWTFTLGLLPASAIVQMRRYTASVRA